MKTPSSDPLELATDLEAQASCLCLGCVRPDCVQKFIVATCIRTLVAEAEAREKDWVDVSRKLDETLDERDAALAVVNEMLNALGEEAWREDYPQLAQRARALLERGK